MAMWQIWLILSGLFFIGEIITVGFFVLWLSIGSLIAMIISIFAPSSIILQTAIFVISSSILILFTKPFVDKYINKSTIKTNSYSLIGKKAIVITDINSLDSTGQVKVNGDVWSAKTDNEEIIKKGTEVEILQINGVKLLVKPCEVTSQFI